MASTKQFLVPDGLAPPVGNGYAHAVSAGGVVYVSGQVGMDLAGQVVVGFEGQARQAFENMKVVLAAAGAELSDVVKVTVFLVELSDLGGYRGAREEFLPHRPASSLLVVASLAMPELRFEIEAIAVPG